jgi:16S rRNA (guanine527-N7)-methyltransferase
MMDFIQQEFIKLLQEQDISLTAVQLAKFELYYHELVEWNEKMNLTAITERDQVYIKHFYDSLSLAFFCDLNAIETLADIGSGAGFPSIPLKIVFPHLRITIVDSLNKRITFLKQLVDKLGLERIDCVHGRAEDIGRLPNYRDQFDLVTARAVARLSVLNEFCLPFVRKGGLFIAMKGSEIEGELLESAYSLAELRGSITQKERMELPFDQSVRHIVRIEKKGLTPAKYPRKAGTPIKDPLLK